MPIQFSGFEFLALAVALIAFGALLAIPLIGRYLARRRARMQRR